MQPFAQPKKLSTVHIVRAATFVGGSWFYISEDNFILLYLQRRTLYQVQWGWLSASTGWSGSSIIMKPQTTSSLLFWHITPVTVGNFNSQVPSPVKVKYTYLKIHIQRKLCGKYSWHIVSVIKISLRNCEAYPRELHWCTGTLYLARCFWYTLSGTLHLVHCFQYIISGTLCLANHILHTTSSTLHLAVIQFALFLAFTLCIHIH